MIDWLGFLIVTAIIEVGIVIILVGYLFNREDNTFYCNA